MPESLKIANERTNVLKHILHSQGANWPWGVHIICIFTLWAHKLLGLLTFAISSYRSVCSAILAFSARSDTLYWLLSVCVDKN